MCLPGVLLSVWQDLRENEGASCFKREFADLLGRLESGRCSSELPTHGRDGSLAIKVERALRARLSRPTFEARPADQGLP